MFLKHKEKGYSNPTQVVIQNQIQSGLSAAKFISQSAAIFPSLHVCMYVCIQSVYSVRASEFERVECLKK